MGEQTPGYLAGHLAPVADEVDAFDLPVEGALPAELTGRYFRNGANPLPGADSGHWFAGHGMVHGIRLDRGRARWYRNRWVRTRQLAGVPPFRPDGSRDLTVNVANTSVIEHGGKIFALMESGFPHQIGTELDTIGPCDFGGRLTTGMTAHPKEDPETGELHLFGRSPRPPFLTYHRLSAGGELITSFPVEVPEPTLMHDFAITGNHVVWLDLPVVLDRETIGNGNTLPYRWSDEHTPRIGLMGKDSPAVRWFEVAPHHVFHVGNAREDEQGRVVLDAVHHNRDTWVSTWARFGGAPDPRPTPFVTSSGLYRWTLDPATGHVAEQELDDGVIEFPTVDDRLVGRPNRYLYAVDEHGVIKYDSDRGRIARHELGENWRAGEAVFVPAGGSSGEDEGWLLSIVTNTDPAVASRLLVHDATAIATKPAASVLLPRRVPSGFHGAWIPDAVG
jgi:carotenoid cleavage dioxygenase-like enzyme